MDLSILEIKADTDADKEKKSDVHITKFFFVLFFFCRGAMLTRCQGCFAEFPLADSSQTANKVSRWEKTKLPQPAVYPPNKSMSFCFSACNTRRVRARRPNKTGT